jgi:hypothetical protein
MKKTRRTAPIVLLLALSLVLTGTVASARPPAQEEVSEDLELLMKSPAAGVNVSDVLGDDADEDGYRGPLTVAVQVETESEASVTQGQAALPANGELQPDDNGYAGAAPRAAQAQAEPSEAQPAEAPNWEQFFAEPQPDQDSYYDAASAEARQPEDWSGFYYIHVAGATLRPRDSSSGWDYPGTGCLSLANGNELLNIHLDIPDGSRIDYLRLYYYDTSGANSTSWITNYDGAGNFSDLISVASTGSAGYGSTLSALLEHVVDTQARAYVLNWQANQTGGSMRLCGLRVAYRLPV